MKRLLAILTLAAALLVWAGCDPTPCDPDQIYADGQCFYPPAVSDDGGPVDGGVSDGG